MGPIPPNSRELETTQLLICTIMFSKRGVNPLPAFHSSPPVAVYLPASVTADYASMSGFRVASCDNLGALALLR